MFLSLLSLFGLAVACADSELHARDTQTHAIHARREYPQVPLTPPYRPLVWGDFNVIHTTDTHGWLLGHQKSVWPEPNYSGDLGDFASFVAHMKRIAIEKDVDLLLVDSGDVHHGTGISDGHPPGSVGAHESNKFLERLPYDLMAIGNHELYVYADTYDMYTNFVPRLHGRYLSSNVNITVFNSNGEVVSVPVGNRYAKFQTRKGRKVTSLGVLYDFRDNAVNTTVQLVADMVKESWFAEVIAEEPDVFVLIGHIPVSRDNWPVVLNAIRAVHPHTPIMIFGGHSHIRDCQQYDGRTMALQSGRYMETIGWMSADLDAAKGNFENVTFSRRYLDQNRVAYQYHTTMSNCTFDTVHGRSITHDLHRLAVEFDLAHLYGTAPQTFTINRDPYPSVDDALVLFITKAAPVALAINNTRAEIPNIIIIKSSEVRHDVFEGPFTKDDQLTAVPYPDSFSYIPNVALSIASQVLPALNGKKVSKRWEEEELWDCRYAERRYYPTWLEEADLQGVQRTLATDLTPGYVTQDGCPGAGDDTRHLPLPPYSPPPTYVGSDPPSVPSDAPIDLVFLSSIESEVLRVLNLVQDEIVYTLATRASSYTPTLANEVLGLYAQAAWN